MSATTGPRDGLLLLAAFASGAAALAYEMLWTRMLALSLGSETVGVLAALAGYFAGLALGAGLLHDRTHRAADPVRLFVLLELVAAGFAVASPHLLQWLARVLPGWLGPVAAAGGAAALAASTAVAAAVLALGAAPLGASLAALVEARRRTCPSDQDGRGLGRIYGANTLGAALAALVSVHLVFPALGYGLGAALAALAGAGAALAARAWGARASGHVPPSMSPATVLKGHVPGDMSSAPASPAAEIAPASRDAGADVNPRVTDAGADVGSRVTIDVPPAARDTSASRFTSPSSRHTTPAPPSVIDASRDPDPDLLREPWLLGLVSFGTGLTGIGLQVVGIRVLGQHLENTIYTFAHILAAYLLATGLGALVYQRFAARAVAGRPGGVIAALLWLLGILVVPAAMVLAQGPALLQALAPEAAGLARAGLAELAVAALVFAPTAVVLGALLSHVIGLVAATGRGVGRTYAYNALGCAAAPFVFGLVAIPRLGYADAFYAVLYAYLALFAVFGWFRRFSPIMLIGGVLAGVAFTAAGPRSLALVSDSDGWVRREERQTLHGLVAVSERPGPGGAPLRRLQIGKRFRMGGAAGFGEQRMGQLCSLLSHASGPEGPIAKALYLGLGTGSTMGGALAVPHAAAEGVELVPEIVELLPHFADINHDLAKRPEATLLAADARRYLAAAPDRYDLIVADLFHPGQAGASSLFAREHFAAAASHLRPGGLMCQWLPLYQLDEADVRTIVRTFLDVFPESYGFLGIYNAQNPALALVGRAPDPAAAQLHLDVARLQADTAKLQNIVDPRDLLASYVMGPGELTAWAGDGPRNTDLAPEIAFQAARVAYRDDRSLGAHNLGAVLQRAAPAPAALLTGSGAEALAAASAPFTAAARHYLTGEIARGDLADLSGMSWETAENFVRAYEADPEFAPARGALYTIARKNSALAAKLLPRMLARTPDEPRVYEAFLNHLRLTGDQTAYQQLRDEAAAKFPDATLP
ncbi:spermidine synthase [Nannocystis bainbridge]|uniref:Spermidine synthase n=1 Tax=Nannocystis bainbridge TaxID=2995303 RepID=A0ABT5E9B4_9BACT|nr:hypothetical protein [Nannocystis bainbridge]MDC0722015.1 hypothetical protein [Nannocystis bainbridge]